MNQDDFPRLAALLDGRLSMLALDEWPLVRIELANYEREVRALRDYAVRLLVQYEGKDEAAARRIVADLKASR